MAPQSTLSRTWCYSDSLTPTVYSNINRADSNVIVCPSKIRADSMAAHHSRCSVPKTSVNTFDN
jgi:hypothetical protein